MKEVRPTQIPKGIGGLEVITIDVPDARDVGIVNMSLQGIPPSESLLTTPDHQSAPNHVRPSLDTLLVRHALLYTRMIKVGPIHTNPAAHPSLRFPPTIVSFDMALEIRYAKVLLDIGTPSDGAVRVKFLVDEQGAVFGLEVARGGTASVRVQAPISTSRRYAPLRFGGSRVRRREGHGMWRARSGSLTLLPVPLGNGLGGVVLVVIVGGNVVGTTIEFGAITGAG